MFSKRDETRISNSDLYYIGGYSAVLARARDELLISMVMLMFWVLSFCATQLLNVGILGCRKLIEVGSNAIEYISNRNQITQLQQPVEPLVTLIDSEVDDPIQLNEPPVIDDSEVDDPIQLNEPPVIDDSEVDDPIQLNEPPVIDDSEVDDLIQLNEPPVTDSEAVERLQRERQRELAWLKDQAARGGLKVDSIKYGRLRAKKRYYK